MLPSRRDALKLGGAALVGGAAMSGSASAGTGQAGTIGTANDPVDIESEDIDNADTINTQTIQPKNIGNGYHYAAAFDGADADARLDNAINTIGTGQTLFLESESYSQVHSFNSDTTIIGVGGGGPGATTIIDGGRFDLSINSLIERVAMDIGSNVVGISMGFASQASCIRQNAGNGTIDIKENACIVTRLKDVDVTINGNSCVVDASKGVSVTDNGSGTLIGDII
jgi:hypothetical protein